MPRYTDDQLMEVCRLCVAYLGEKYPTEAGLFRSSVAQTDVRVLQSQIIEQQSTLQDDPDPHLVAEVLQTCLKNLQYPLMHEVYKEIVSTDLDAEDLDLSELSIQKWVVRLPDVKFHLTSSLFRLLAQLAAADESDSSLIQLAYCLSPAICRPTNSAYMSIRHMADLRRIRPVVSFIVENFEEVFEGVLPMSAGEREAYKQGQGGLGLMQVSGSGSEADIASLMSTSMVIDSPNSPSTSAATTLGSAHTNTLTALTSAATASFSASVSSTLTSSAIASYSEDEPERPALRLPPPINTTDIPHKESSPAALLLQSYTEQEWYILEMLILNTSTHFLELDGPKLPPMGAGANAGVGEASPTSPTAPSSSSHPRLIPSPTSAEDTLSDASADIPAPPSRGRNRRRKMVADCKAMRVQIFEFEQGWSRLHNRIPKSFERGAMETVYSHYRKLKKEIRDLAATDLQRVYRGYAARVAPSSGLRRSKRISMSGLMEVDSSQATRVGLGEGGGFSRAGELVPGLGLGGAGVVGGIPPSLYAAYRDLLEKKRELKRRLKKFDEDFSDTWGRLPKKSDKEVIRPMYQHYHEIKAKLDEQRAVIEASHGPLPADLQEDGPAATPRSDSSARSDTDTDSDMFAAYVGAGPMDTGAKYGSDEEEDKAWRGGPGAVAGGGFGDAVSKQYSEDANTKTSVGVGMGVSAGSAESDVETLLLEKKNLHAYLKVYERDFSRMHGRPVTKHSDIQPVAHEYQRYKELKSMIKEKKSGK